MRQAEASLGVNFAVTQRLVNQLEDYRILEEVSGLARNRIYQVTGIIDVIPSIW